MYIETCVTGADLGERDIPKNSEGVYRKFVEFLQYKLQIDVDNQRLEKEQQDKKEEDMDKEQSDSKRKGDRKGPAHISQIHGKTEDEVEQERWKPINSNSDSRRVETREKKREEEQEERTVPLFDPGVCGGSQIRGNSKYSLIDIDSLSFSYDHQAAPATLDSDFLWATAETLMQTSALSGRSPAEKTGFIQAGDGKGFFRHLLGDLGFSSLVVSKSPDASSSSLFQLASQTNDTYNCLG